jgi:hypothetical protein
MSITPILTSTESIDVQLRICLGCSPRGDPSSFGFPQDSRMTRVIVIPVFLCATRGALRRTSSDGNRGECPEVVILANTKSMEVPRRISLGARSFVLRVPSGLEDDKGDRHSRPPTCDPRRTSKHKSRVSRGPRPTVIPAKAGIQCKRVLTTTRVLRSTILNLKCLWESSPRPDHVSGM